jgi:hypothetical protein
MVLPYDLQYDKISNFSGDLLGFCFTGCPDFSSLNWISFYQMYLSSLSGIKINFRQNDIKKQFDKINKKQARALLGTYTDLVTHKKNDKQILNSLELLAREEISGGAFIRGPGLKKHNLYPNTYNEDWIWSHNSRSTIPMFYKTPVEHRSKKRKVLNMNSLKREEIGEIYETLLTDSYLNQEVSYALKNRNKVMRDTIQNCNKLIKNIDDNDHKKTLILIRSLLMHTNEYTKLINVNTINKDIRSFRKKNLTWTKLLNQVENDSVNLFRSTENERRLWTNTSNFSTLR